MRKKLIVKRKELFEAVWERAMIHVARDYGVSDVGLKKICKRLAIPTPGRGYWRRKEQGYKVDQPELPDLPNGAETEATIYPTISHTSSGPDISSNDNDRIRAALSTAVLVSGEHDLVRRSRKSLGNAKIDEKGILVPGAKRVISTKITADSQERALHGIDLIIKGLEELGCRVSVNAEKNPKLRVNIDDEELGISIEEKISARPYERKPSDKGRSNWELPRYDYFPTGKLTVRIQGDLPYGIRTSWSDGRVQRIEFIIDKILIGLHAAASAQTQKRIDDEKRRLEWEEQQRRAEEARQLRRLEKQREKHLGKIAMQHEEAVRIRRFVEKVENNKELLSEIRIQDMNITSWLEWAKQYSKEIDPFEYQHWWDIENQVPIWEIDTVHY